MLTLPPSFDKLVDYNGRFIAFSPASREVRVVEKPDRLDLYFQHHGSLQTELGHWKGAVEITCCESGGDIFTVEDHRRIVCGIRDDSPVVTIKEAEPTL